MGIMGRDKNEVEMNALAFESVVGMAKRRRMLDRERGNRVDFIGERATGKQSCSLMEFVIGDAKIPFISGPASAIEHQGRDSYNTAFYPMRLQKSSYLEDLQGAMAAARGNLIGRVRGSLFYGRDWR